MLIARVVVEITGQQHVLAAEDSISAERAAGERNIVVADDASRCGISSGGRQRSAQHAHSAAEAVVSIAQLHRSAAGFNNSRIAENGRTNLQRTSGQRGNDAISGDFENSAIGAEFAVPARAADADPGRA